MEPIGTIPRDPLQSSNPCLSPYKIPTALLVTLHDLTQVTHTKFHSASRYELSLARVCDDPLLQPVMTRTCYADGSCIPWGGRHLKLEMLVSANWAHSITHVSPPWLPVEPVNVSSPESLTCTTCASQTKDGQLARRTYVLLGWSGNEYFKPKFKKRFKHPEHPQQERRGLQKSIHTSDLSFPGLRAFALIQPSLEKAVAGSAIKALQNTPNPPPTGASNAVRPCPSRAVNSQDL